MRKLLLTFLLLGITFAASAQLKIGTYGNVGIGTTSPHYKFDLNLGTTDTFRIHTWMDAFVDNTGAYGAVCFYPEHDYFLQLGKNGFRIGQIWACELKALWSIEYSDYRLKENIRPIENPLQKIRLVNGVQYNLTSENFNDIPTELTELYMRNDYGFIAQELQDVFPEVVVEDDNGFLSVKYTRLIPVLVEAIKVQQNTIDSIQQSFTEERSLMMEKISELQKKITQISLANQEELNTSSSMHTYQNAPNPFSETTLVRCFIPDDMYNVQLCIYDMTGVQQKCINIDGHGMVDVQIAAGELSAGIYIYLLQSGGQVSEAKQMIITK